jgi:outer membrane autotransporter protein
MVGVRCAWARITGLHSKFHETFDNAGYTAKAAQIAAGGEVVAEGGWRVAGALAWDNTVLRNAAAASSKGDRYQLGVGARRAFGAFELSAVLAVGEARNDLSRQLPEGGATVKAKGIMRSAAAWFGGAYAVGDESLHLKPRFDVGLVKLRMAGFDESGGEPLRLRVNAQSDTYTVLRPGIEMGAEFRQADGLRVRPRLTLALSQFVGGAAPSASAVFAADPLGTPSFMTKTRLDRTQAALTAGLQMLGSKGTVVTADVLANASNNTRDYGLSVRMNLPF